MMSVAALGPGAATTVESSAVYQTIQMKLNVVSDMRDVARPSTMSGNNDGGALHR